MRQRSFGRTDWQVSEVGYGMWGMGGWTGSNDEESLRALDRAIALGCNFFDTAWVYGMGRSERLLGQALRARPDARAVIATKIPPKNMRWPGSAEYPVASTYPPNHIRQYTEKSLKNLGVETIDLQQFHVWSDAWASDADWQRAVDDLKREKLVRAFGISVNRWEPTNVFRALDTGLIDSVQVVYNVFDQAPEDELFPYCQRHNIAIIARVPFDEGSLAGTLTRDSRWPDGDWRNIYFTPENLATTLDRVDRLRPLVPEDMDLPELALRFILEHPAVSTTIPGMRRPRHVERNLAASDGVRLPPRLRDALRTHRWDRTAVIQ
ncbi:MAG: aldo/keto reductase [Acidobacteria bacterium RIFCSPLOWO2_12_FULL_65_11]|nr:MAG: aldo/keto reductase [Acidobacteria bacterium RIFCSPLOWO2_02_FULL_64_15]OFW30367.1 MAG: aldo/keto reductase [Acidobacteria bacterium RIFCSPLOWO2_12_FULL_65_11]